MFIAMEGKFKTVFRPKKASTALGFGAIWDYIDGYLEVCTIARASHYGAGLKVVTSADDDYAATTLIPVQIPVEPSALYLADAASGVTLLATDAGNYLDIGGSPVGDAITNASSDDDAVFVDRVLTAYNKAMVALNSSKYMKNGVGTAV